METTSNVSASPTPALSRSGRVIKKSAKLLEMETDMAKSNKISKQNQPHHQQQQTLKIVSDSIVDHQSNSKLTNNLTNVISGIGVGQIHTESISESSNVAESMLKLSKPPSQTTPQPKKIINTTASPVIFQANPSIDSGPLIIRMKSSDPTNKDQTSNQTISISLKRDDTESSNEIEKRFKSLASSSSSSSTEQPKISFIQNTGQLLQGTGSTESVHTTNSSLIKIVTPSLKSNLPTFKSKIFQQNSLTLSSSPSLSTSSLNKPTINYAQQQQSTVLPRSIQEQRRINIAKKAKLQQQQKREQEQQFQMMKSNMMNNSNTSKSDETSGDNNQNKTKVKKSSISPYVLWCKENRSLIQSNYPELNFCDLSRKMGEIWHTLPGQEKATWVNKAKIMSKHISTGVNSNTFFFNAFKAYYDDIDLKPDIVLDSLTLPITKSCDQEFAESFIANNDLCLYDGETHQIGIDFFLDVQAYLSILGDSLQTIGSYIQRGIKYESEMNYSPLAGCSTLLDTALVSMSTMASLCLSLPKNFSEKIDKTRMKKAIDNSTYFMPPSEFN